MKVSPDSDWPAKGVKTSKSSINKSRKVLLFDVDREYITNTELNHGLQSHAIKHMIEFDSQFVADHLERFRVWLETRNKTTYTILIKGKKGKGNQKTTMKTKDIDLGTLLNTLDLVNDRVMMNEGLTIEEQELWKYHQLIKERYLEILNVLSRNIVDVSNMKFSSADEIYKFAVQEFPKKESANFLIKSTYKEQDSFVILHISSGTLCMGTGDNYLHPSTLFPLMKYDIPKSLNEVLRAFGKRYGSGLKPEYSYFSELVKKYSQQ